MKSTHVYFCLFSVVFLALCGCYNSPMRVKPINQSLFSDSTSMDASEFPLLPQTNGAEHHVKIRVPKVGESISISDCIHPDSVVKYYRFIPLKTSEDEIIGEISSAHMADSIIFVVDHLQQSIFRFSLEGEYLGRIGTLGNGHGEFSSLYTWSFSLDKKNKEACVIDFPKKQLLFYSYEGKFLRAEPMYYLFNSIAFGDSLVYSHTITYENPEWPGMSQTHVVYSRRDMVPMGGFLYDENYPSWTKSSVPFAVQPAECIKPYPDGTFYINILSPDTIWKTDNKSIWPYVALKQDGRGDFIPIEKRKTTSTDDYFNRMKDANICTKYDFSKNTGIMNIRRDNLILLDKNSGRYLSGDWACGRFEEYKIMYNPSHLQLRTWDWEKDEFYTILDPIALSNSYKDYLLDDKEKVNYAEPDRKLLESVKETDNPILLIMCIQVENQ